MMKINWINKFCLPALLLGVVFSLNGCAGIGKAIKSDFIIQTGLANQIILSHYCKTGSWPKNGTTINFSYLKQNYYLYINQCHGSQCEVYFNTKDYNLGGSLPADNNTARFIYQTAPKLTPGKQLININTSINIGPISGQGDFRYSMTCKPVFYVSKEPLSSS